MDRITRKDLKTDKFALEVEHTVDYIAEHRKAVIRYTAIGVAIVVLVAAIFFYRRHEHAAREAALTKAMQTMEAPVGAPPVQGMQSFPTQAAKNEAVQKALAQVASQYSGSDEGTIARYYMGVNQADQGNMAEAEKAFRDVIDNGSANYASLAKLALSDIYKSQGKTADAEKLLRSLVDKPTIFVSKDTAKLLLGQLLVKSNPAEAKKLLDEVAATRSAASRQALTTLAEMQPQK